MAAVQKRLHRLYLASDAEPVLITNSGVEYVFNRVQSVTCNWCDLMDEINNPDATLRDLNSECTPTSKGFDIVVKWVLKNTNL